MGEVSDPWFLQRLRRCPPGVELGRIDVEESGGAQDVSAPRVSNDPRSWCSPSFLRDRRDTRDTMPFRRGSRDRSSTWEGTLDFSLRRVATERRSHARGFAVCLVWMSVPNVVLVHSFSRRSRSFVSQGIPLTSSGGKNRSQAWSDTLEYHRLVCRDMGDGRARGAALSRSTPWFAGRARCG